MYKNILEPAASLIRWHISAVSHSEIWRNE